MRRFITDDRWMMDFLENNDYHVSNAAKQCFETLEWRQKFGVNGEFDLWQWSIRVWNFALNGAVEK